ncbi:MAG TPA: PAS domain-containing protein [Actinomycetota bacterium]|nr:PAS domain-containing protein [Actinomycetota bacterium]
MTGLSKLRASVKIDALLENLVRSAPNPIFMKDPEGRYLYANTAWEEAAGVSGAAVVGHTDFDFFPQEVAASFQEGDLEAVGGEAPVQRVEPFIKDGEVRTYCVVKFPIFSETNDLLGSCGVAVEITPAIQVEQVRARERGRLARELHDDALQVMATVALRLETLELKTEAPTSGILEELRVMVGDVLQRLRTLTSDMQVADPAVDLAASIQARLEALEYEHSISFAFDDSLENGPYPLVATALDHIVSEALINITKHARATRVTVSLADLRDGIKVTIADDGIGFDEGAERSAEHMGIASMRSRARAMGGQLLITSRPRGGTRIEVWAPAKGEGSYGVD